MTDPRDAEDDLSFDLEDIEALLNSIDTDKDASIAEDYEHPPEEVTELDIGAYPQFEVGTFGSTGDFVREFLRVTKTPFASEGIGEFQAVLIWPQRQWIDDEYVTRYVKAVRAQVSRLRQSVKNAPIFNTVQLEYKILPDKKSAYVSMARMSPAYFAEFMKMRRGDTMPRSVLKDMEGLL